MVYYFDRLPTEEDIAHYLVSRAELVGADSPPVLIEVIRIPYVDRSIRESFVKGLTRSPAPCRAVVTPDPSLQRMFHTYEMVEPVDIPSETFPSVEAAVEWIEGLKPRLDSE